MDTNEFWAFFLPNQIQIILLLSTVAFAKQNRHNGTKIRIRNLPEWMYEQKVHCLHLGHPPIAPTVVVLVQGNVRDALLLKSDPPCHRELLWTVSCGPLDDRCGCVHICNFLLLFFSYCYKSHNSLGIASHPHGCVAFIFRGSIISKHCTRVDNMVARAVLFWRVQKHCELSSLGDIKLVEDFCGLKKKQNKTVTYTDTLFWGFLRAWLNTNRPAGEWKCGLFNTAVSRSTKTLSHTHSVLLLWRFYFLEVDGFFFFYFIHKLGTHTHHIRRSGTNKPNGQHHRNDLSSYRRKAALFAKSVRVYASLF